MYTPGRYTLPPDLQYIKRFSVNRGLMGFERAIFETPSVPYRELSSAPLKLVRQQQGLAGLGGFFRTSKKWRRRNALMQQDIAILKWWGYKFTREDEKHIRMVEFEVAKERAERSGLSRVTQDIAIPVALTVITAGAATPFVLGMAATTAGVGALATRKAEKQAISGAEKAFVINEDMIKTKHEVDDIQKEIAEMTAAMGVPKSEVNKAVQNAANKQQQEKKALTTILMVGSALGVAAMAA